MGWFAGICPSAAICLIFPVDEYKWLKTRSSGHCAGGGAAKRHSPGPTDPSYVLQFVVESAQIEGYPLSAVQMDNSIGALFAGSLGTGPSLSPEHHAWLGICVVSFIDYDRPIHEHIIDPLWRGRRILVGSHVLDCIIVKDRNVGPDAVANYAPVKQSELRRWP